MREVLMPRMIQRNSQRNLTREKIDDEVDGGSHLEEKGDAENVFDVRLQAERQDAGVGVVDERRQTGSRDAVQIDAVLTGFHHVHAEQRSEVVRTRRHHHLVDGELADAGGARQRGGGRGGGGI